MRLKDIAVGRKDLFLFDPNIIQEEPGWNVRMSDPELDAHIRMLADSIKEIGVREPITVRLEGGVPFLTNGHCRLAAVKLAIAEGAEIKTIPAQAEDRYASEADRVLGMITRNSGKPLTPLEQGEVFKRLLLFGWKEIEIVKKTGLSGVHVANMLLLSGAPTEVTAMVRDGSVSARHAVATIRKEGEKATGMLQQAVQTAKESGKTKATQKHMPKKKVVATKTEPATKETAPAEGMALERAYVIVQACSAVISHHTGLSEEEPPSLKEYSLPELIEARDLVRTHHAEMHWSKNTSAVLEDRFIAALYVAGNFFGFDSESCEAVVRSEGVGVFIINLDAGETKEDAG